MFHHTLDAWLIEQGIGVAAPFLAAGVAAPFLSAGVAIFVAFKGYKNALKQQALDYQHQFQIRTYEKILGPIEDQTQKASLYMVALESFSSDVMLRYNAQQRGQPLPPAFDKYGSEHYFHMYLKYLDSITAVMKSLESIYIIEPKLKIFVTALSSVHWDAQLLFREVEASVFKFSSKTVIGSNQQEVRISPDVASKAEAESLARAIRKISDQVQEGLSYLDDLKIELQNLLLGKIYGANKLEHRQPLDPNKIVIKTQNYEDLAKHFKENTAAGKEQTKHEKAATDRLKDAQ